MSSSWENIADLLRSELQGYGGLLALFEEQQSRLFTRDATSVLELSLTIESQTHATAEHRLRREMATREVAESLGQTADANLRAILPSFPVDVQPMLGALLDEINHLIHRVRRGARQNQQLLARAVEMHQETLRMIRPVSFVKTYSPRGQVNVSVGEMAFQAAG